MSYDLVIAGGEVIDPATRSRRRADVAVTAGRIAAIGPELAAEPGCPVIDAAGRFVVPGLIDLHVHVYPGHTPLGLDADSLCASGGVTTMLDTGSAGCNTFAGFRRDCIDRAHTRVLALVNLSRIGLAAADLGELLDPRYASAEGVVATLEAHPGVAVGVKIRAGAHIIGTGEVGWQNLRDAVRAAREAGTTLMVHIGECPMSIPELLGELAPGDCITHCFKGGSTRILDDEGQPWPEVRAAAAAGVVFDVGHGAGSFSWTVAEAAIGAGFPPTTISTDLHTGNVNGPVYDLPTTMSKLLHLGVSLEQVIEMSTLAPARYLGREQELGILREGGVADIAVLELQAGRFVLTDSYGQTRTAERCLRAVATVRGGQVVPGGGGWSPPRA